MTVWTMPERLHSHLTPGPLSQVCGVDRPPSVYFVDLCFSFLSRSGRQYSVGGRRRKDRCWVVRRGTTRVECRLVLFSDVTVQTLVLLLSEAPPLVTLLTPTTPCLTPLALLSCDVGVSKLRGLEDSSRQSDWV